MSIEPGALLQKFVELGASDLYLTVDAPASFRISDNIKHYNTDKLKEADIYAILNTLISQEGMEEFKSTLEFNTAVNWNNKARFRINIFRQRQFPGAVIRRIRSDIPSVESLGLPQVYADMIMEKRGLVLLVGPTGSGKSTSLAAMIGHRNLHGSGHIVTIEDPVEFIHDHKNCIITQRDVGIDTYSFGIGLKNALRQTPDVIVVGEVRDRETMEHAIVFSETGHLCLATLHANNTNQAIERIINFFPEEKHPQILLNLSFNLKAILSQRLVRNRKGGRTMLIEILLNQGLIRNLIQEGRIREIRECMEKNLDAGMRTFDQHCSDLFINNVISEEVALAESDNAASVRLSIKRLEIDAQNNRNKKA
jgi:twitching motility protein PilU